MKLVCALALFAIGVVIATDTGSTETPGTTNNRHRRSGAEVFLSIVGERPSDKSNVNAPILPVQLPIQLGGYGAVTLPVLVIPVPVYTNNPESCSATHHNVPANPTEPAQALLPNIPYVQIRQQFAEAHSTRNPQANTQPQEPETVVSQQQELKPVVSQQQELKPEVPQQQEPEPEVLQQQEPEPEVLQQKEPEPVTSQQQEVKPVVPQQQEPEVPQHQEPVPVLLQQQEPEQVVLQQQQPEPVVPQQHVAEPVVSQHLGVVPAIEINQLEQSQPDKSLHITVTSSKHKVVHAPVVDIPTRKESLNMNLDADRKTVSYKVDGQTSFTPQAPVSFEQATSVVEEENIPFSDGSPIFETSEQMIQSFLRQSPVAPELPAVIPDLRLPDRLPKFKSSSVNSPPIPAPSPPLPDFNRSLHLRVDLTVPHSDYTEAYDIQWHAESNTAQSVIEDGSTIIYRAPLADGRIQFLEIRLERIDGHEVRHCTLSPLMPASPADRSFPGLPAFDQFEFTGYTSAEGRSLVERWRRVVTGGPGEGGAAEGETLTFNHEMLIIRDRGQAVPLRYTVVTDSSVLGPASDSYTHRYSQLSAPTAAVVPDVPRNCDVFDEFHDHHEHHEQQYEEKRPQRDIGSLLSRVVPKFDPIREFAGPTRDTRYDSILITFKKQFKRKYLDPAEEAVRKNLLVKSTRFIEAGNRLASGFKMASNFLADRLDDEINQLLGVQAPPDGSGEPGLVPFPYSNNEVKKISNELGDEFDWRPLGAVSPVRFQETTCSSCWAFAVAGSTEGALFKKTNKLVPLSPQCLVDCGKPFGTNGCNGTWPSFAYDYVQARGLPAWDEYTNYQAKVLECKDKIVPPVTHISGHVNVTAFSQSALKVAIKNHAPNVVIVDAKANSFIYYKSGVLKDKRCGQNKPRLNHAVLAVGWGTKDGPHFIIKNTWSAKWGEEGYIRIAPDTCAVLERPSYALVEEPNIDREELRAAAATVRV